MGSMGTLLYLGLCIIIAGIQFVLLAVVLAFSMRWAKYLVRSRNGHVPYETPSRRVRISLVGIACAVALIAGVLFAGTSVMLGSARYRCLDGFSSFRVLAYFPDGLARLIFGGGWWGEILRQQGTGGIAHWLDPSIVAWRTPWGLLLPGIYVLLWLSYIMLVVVAVTAPRRGSFLASYAILSALLTLNALGWQNYRSYLLPEYLRSPGNLEINYYKGISDVDQGNYDQASAHFSEAIKLGVTRRAAMSEGDLAWAASEQILKDADAYQARGLIYRMQGLKPKAIADFQMYLTLLPNSPDRAQVQQLIEELK